MDSVGKSATEQVQFLDDQRLAATLSGDLTALEAIYAQDLRYVHATGAVERRDDILAVLRDNPGRYRKLYRTDWSATAFGQLVVATGTFVAEVGPETNPSSLQASFTSIWIEVGETWRMIHWHATRLA